MSQTAALAHAVEQALSTVASTTGLPWHTKRRIFAGMEQAIRAHAYPNPTPADFAVWAEEELADLLSREDIRPLCRFALASWFAGGVIGCLSGSFDYDGGEAAD